MREKRTEFSCGKLADKLRQLRRMAFGLGHKRVHTPEKHSRVPRIVSTFKIPLRRRRIRLLDEALHLAHRPRRPDGALFAHLQITKARRCMIRLDRNRHDRTGIRRTTERRTQLHRTGRRIRDKRVSREQRQRRALAAPRAHQSRGQRRRRCRIAFRRLGDDLARRQQTRERRPRAGQLHLVGEHKNIFWWYSRAQPSHRFFDERPL